MRIVEEKMRNREGEIKLIPETLDDLWHLKYIIEPNDIVFSLTKRISESSDKLRSDKEKVTVRLGIKVEKVEFHRFANRLRVTGTIVAGVEDSGYHTINITPGKELSIIKEKWKDEQLERIRSAIESSKRPDILIVTMEEGEAYIGALRDWGVEEIAVISRSYGKDLGSYRQEFFGEVLSVIKNIKFEYVIIAGPGFTKDDFIKFLRERSPDLSDRIVKADISSVGSRGFIEVLKRGVVEKIAGEIRIAKEAEYMERLLEGIAKGKNTVYGKDEVVRAHEYGAIDTLLIADEYLLRERENWDIDGLMRSVEDSGGKVVILSSDFEPGKQLMSLGGIAGLLRFQIE
jgi:protein pelota